MENFDRLQGSASAIRPNEDRPQPAASLYGVRKMLTFLTSRPVLAATTFIAALMIGVAVILPVADIRIGQAPLEPRKAESPVVGSQNMPEGKSATLAETREAPVDLVRKASPDIATPETTVAEAPAAGSEAPVTIANAVPDAPAPVTDAADNSLALTVTRQRFDSLAGVEADNTLRYLAPEGMPASMPEAEMALPPEANTEADANAPANPVTVTAEDPVSTFSIDVDTASYAMIRSSLTYGSLPIPEQVRVEEMINYFPYAYPTPEAFEAPFNDSISVMKTHWNPGTRLVTIGLQGIVPAITERPPLNLVFLIDTSGSIKDSTSSACSSNHSP